MKTYKSLFVITLLLFFSASAAYNALPETKNKVADSPNNICPLLTGAAIPKTELQAIDGKSFDLNKAVSEKPTLLIFYRGGWCPYCNKHLQALQEIEKDMIGLGYQILAVSMDRPEKLSETLGKDHLTYTLLSDSKANAVKAFGLAYKLDDETLAKYKTYGIDIEGDSGEKHHILPVPAAFIIGTDGIIKFEYINPDYKVRIDAGLLLSAAKNYVSK